MQLVGLIARATKDIDVVAQIGGRGLVGIEALPAPLEEAVRDIAAVFGLPPGILQRAHRRTWGGLVLQLADRRDHIFFKLYAAADQGPRSKHFEDLLRLRPTADELHAAAARARTHDTSDAFEGELRRALAALGVDDGAL